MKNNAAGDYISLIKNINQLMQASLEAYRNYMQHGKSFRYAKELRKCNSDMIDLLNKNAGLLNEELAIASAALTEHYTTWRNKWDRHQEVLQPGADDVFAFANDHTFPKQAAAVFEQEYRRLFPGLSPGGDEPGK